MLNGPDATSTPVKLKRTGANSLNKSMLAPVQSQPVVLLVAASVIHKNKHRRDH